MSDIKDELLEQHIRAAQITNTIRFIRLYLVSIFIACIYTFCLYQFYFSQTSVYFNSWFIITAVSVSSMLMITTLYFKKGQFSPQTGNYWLKFVCLMTGILIAIGIALLYYYLPSINPDFSEFHALILSGLLILVSQTFALTYLTQRLSFFLLVAVPTVLPYVASQIFMTSQSDPLFHLVTNFILIILLLCANAIMNMHSRLTGMYYRNNVLKKNAEQQASWSDELCQQLQSEMNKSKDIELQLQLNNQLLEQKVRERIYDIELMHKNLQEQQDNLNLAHEIAGLNPWDWNIKERHFSITNEQQQTRKIDARSHQLLLQNKIHPDDITHLKTSMKHHLRGKTERYETTYRLQNTKEKWYWVHDTGRVIERDPQSGKPLRMVGIRRNIHQERTDQERLRLAASVLEQAAEGIFILNEDLCYIDTNPFYEKISGFNREQILGKHLFDITANYKSQQRSKHNEIVQQLLETHKYDAEFNEKFLSGKELSIRLHISAIKDEQDRIIHYIGIVTDLTERKLQEQRLSYLENYDPLTDLPNRFYYNYQLHQYLVSQEDSINQFAIIRLNIDRFRPLNEYLTNNGGDELLRQVAQRLRLTNTEALFLAHLNGDDFAIVYEISHIRTSVQQHCERIAKAFSMPFNISGQDHIITLSMGVSFYPEHGRQLDYLNNCAEQALSEAKRLGGNTIKYYSKENTKLLEQGIYLERDLRHAIQNNELIVYYQPKINFRDQQIYGFEALVRWNHPVKGIIPPNMFIPLAEQTSLISDIGRIVIQQTAKQIQEWNKKGFKNICVSVNIVAQQLQRGQLIEDLDAAISTYNISGESLELEITESSLVENSESVKDVLQSIKQRKIHISLDDFGTGYSSLSYLADFPIDILKIDRSFVSKIGQAKQEAIVSAMVAMGKAMGMTVVAEGIETQQQLNYLQSLECDIAQGYLFSRPLPEQDATIYLEQNMQSPTYT
ncbi:EAL domain-containing protein [Acinetobacter chinensis]|uniref:cyclic-guanylate-specific phosphodiesterase n=1 Tax=Acinetobacter chinensis TaxID=2004650 RepID=A0A3B7LTL1_9GAMM|nr:EAL domain-containing protein [Acinetobacter chinensis]AXY56180.1 EAL domain-containing protein [Acinetobacter chinensis]